MGYKYTKSQRYIHYLHMKDQYESFIRSDPDLLAASERGQTMKALMNAAWKHYDEYLTKIEVQHVLYHRNGTDGNGFAVVRFKCHDSRLNLIGIVFPEKGNVAVVDPVEPDSRFDGGYYEDDLRKAAGPMD